MKIAAAAAASGVALSVISSGTNENLTINAKGSGGITIAGTSTGNVVIGNSGATVTFNATTGAITGTGNFTITKASGVLSESLTASASQVQVSYTGNTGVAYYLKDTNAGADLKTARLQVQAGVTEFNALTDAGALKSTFIDRKSVV